jgi:hypothetical protein
MVDRLRDFQLRDFQLRDFQLRDFQPGNSRAIPPE